MDLNNLKIKNLPSSLNVRLGGEVLEKLVGVSTWVVCVRLKYQYRTEELRGVRCGTVQKRYQEIRNGELEVYAEE